MDFSRQHGKMYGKVIKRIKAVPAIKTDFLEIFFPVDNSTIQRLLDEIDVFEKVTAILDRHERSWYKFGWKFEIDRKDLESLKPDPIPSPTKLMMKDIVQAQPDLTMKTFLETLATIKRFDVIKALKGFFHRKIFLQIRLLSLHV